MGDIVSKYSILSKEDRKEIDDLIQEKLKAMVVYLLEKLGYIGMDCSMEISIFDYGVVRQDSTGGVVAYSDGYFDLITVSDETILDNINEADNGFFLWLDEDDVAYIDRFHESQSKASFVRDFIVYGGTCLDQELTYPYSFEQIIIMLRNELNIKEGK